VRILVVGMSNSIHTAKWLAQLDGAGSEVHLFPSLELSVHSAIHGVHDLGYSHIAGRDGLAPEGSVRWTRFKAVQVASQFLGKTRAASSRVAREVAGQDDQEPAARCSPFT